ncbi:MAG: GGDEF domain-containing protein [Burkholderiales bacterium]
MIEFVNRIAELTSCRDREQLDVALARALRDLLQPHSVTILRCVGEGDDRHWLTRARLSVGSAVATFDEPWSELHALPKLVASDARGLAFSEQRMVRVHGPPHLTCFPLYGGSAVVGVIEIETPSAPDENAERTVQGVLRIYRNFERLLHYSERDALTGLLNRKTFDESFLKATADLELPSEYMSGDRRVGGSSCGYWIGVIDIDNFKSVNDRFGHLIGDEVLLLLSRLMGRSFRIHDRLYRFGGDEFLVLMRCHGEDDATQVFQRFRSNTELFQFPQVGTVTVSVGFAAVRPGDTPGSAFERADKAVYHAKANGRNQVCGHTELLASAVLVEHDARIGASNSSSEPCPSAPT